MGPPSGRRARSGFPVLGLLLLVCNLCLGVAGNAVDVRAHLTFNELRALVRSPTSRSVRERNGERCFDAIDGVSPLLRDLWFLYQAQPTVRDGTRSILFRCKRGGGGLGDRFRGMATALLVAMISTPPRRFFLVCDDAYNEEVVWVPTSEVCSDGYDFRFKQFATDEAPLVVEKFASLNFPDRFSEMMEEVLFSNRSNIIMSTNLHKVGSIPKLLRNETFPHLFRWIRPAFAGLSKFGGREPFVHLFSTHEIVRLLNAIIAPSRGLQDRIVTHFNRRVLPSAASNPLLLAVHLRIGTPSPDALYKDPTRMNVSAAVPLACECARNTSRARLGGFDGVQWFVAADNNEARAGLDACVPGTDGVIRAMEAKTVFHLDKSPANDSTGFLDAHEEHFFLSSAHFLVRSGWCGYSMTAEVLGNVPRSLVVWSGHKVCMRETALDLVRYW